MAMPWPQYILAERRATGVAEGGTSGARRRRRPTQEALALEARRYILEHFADGERTSTGAMAEALGVTASHLCHVYQRVFGSTIGEHVRRLRIQKAMQLLRDPDACIKQVAADVGYAKATYRAFFNAFRKETGMSPTAYRRQARRAAREAGAAERSRPAGDNDRSHAA